MKERKGAGVFGLNGNTRKATAGCAGESRDIPAVDRLFPVPVSTENSRGELRCMSCGGFPEEYMEPCSCGAANWNPKLKSVYGILHLTDYERQELSFAVKRAMEEGQ